MKPILTYLASSDIPFEAQIVMLVVVAAALVAALACHFFDCGPKEVDWDRLEQTDDERLSDLHLSTGNIQCAGVKAQALQRKIGGRESK